MRTTQPGLALLAALALLGLDPAAAPAQERVDPTEIPPEVRAQGRQLQGEARAHVEAQRWALAAQTYQELYDLSREHGVSQAPIALWNVGLALLHIPGREAEARDAFRRFLDESTTLTDEAQVRDWRSTALEHIAELDARIGASGGDREEAANESDAVLTDPGGAPSTGGGFSPSPVGIAILAAGAASLIAGAIVGGVLIAENDSLVGMCPGGTCPRSARSQAEGVRLLGLAADITLIGGAVIAATGLALMFLLREDAQDSPVAVGCGPDGCGLQLRREF